MPHPRCARPSTYTLQRLGAWIAGTNTPSNSMRWINNTSLSYFAPRMATTTTPKCGAPCLWTDFFSSTKNFPLRPLARLDTKPLSTPHDKMECCPNCKGKFILLQDTAELCCTQCGRLETIFGAIFDLQCLYTNYKYQTRPKKRSTKKYNFSYYLNRALVGCKDCTQLSTDQISQALDTFAFIESYLPKRISYPFVAYKILDCILPQGKQRLFLAYLENEIPQSTRHKHERSWKYMLAGLNRTD